MKQYTRPYYELDNSYMSGFDDARQKALDIVWKYVHGPYSADKQDFVRRIFEELKDM